jgi:hypothetical protein
MRTPPPVLPPANDGDPAYRSTWLDRTGPDGPMRMKAYASGILVGGVAMMGLALGISQRKLDFPGAWLAAVLLAVGIGWLGSRTAVAISNSAGAVAREFTLPSGNSTPYEQTFSFQESLAARGDVAGALESYEAIIAEQPALISVRLRAAEHYARSNRNPKRAAELFKQIRDIPGVPARDAVYASSRLVDLYDGPLDDPGRALVELRRIIEQYPASDVAKHARTALPALKARSQPS